MATQVRDYTDFDKKCSQLSTRVALTIALDAEAKHWKSHCLLNETQSVGQGLQRMARPV